MRAIHLGYPMDSFGSCSYNSTLIKMTDSFINEGVDSALFRFEIWIALYESRIGCTEMSLVFRLDLCRLRYGYDVATPMLRDVIKLRTNAANHV